MDDTGVVEKRYYPHYDDTYLHTLSMSLECRFPGLKLFLASQKFASCFISAFGLLAFRVTAGATGGFACVALIFRIFRLQIKQMLTAFNNLLLGIIEFTTEYTCNVSRHNIMYNQLCISYNIVSTIASYKCISRIEQCRLIKRKVIVTFLALHFFFDTY